MSSDCLLYVDISCIQFSVDQLSVHEQSLFNEVLFEVHRLLNLFLANSDVLN